MIPSSEDGQTSLAANEKLIGTSSERHFFYLCLTLSIAGGFADAGSFVLVGSFTGHVTGNFLLFAIAVVGHQWPQALACVLAVSCFLVGTACGALWPHMPATSPGRRLVLPLILEMALIVVGVLAATMLPIRPGEGLFICCIGFELGIRNGIMRKFGSVPMHTTFITGMSTSFIVALAAGKRDLARIIHEKCAVKAKPLISFTTMRMGCLVKFFAMKSLAQVFGGLGRFRAVR